MGRAVRQTPAPIGATNQATVGKPFHHLDMAGQKLGGGAAQLASQCGRRAALHAAARLVEVGEPCLCDRDIGYPAKVEHEGLVLPEVGGLLLVKGEQAKRPGCMRPRPAGGVGHEGVKDSPGRLFLGKHVHDIDQMAQPRLGRLLISRKRHPNEVALPERRRGQAVRAAASTAANNSCRAA
jgi:hypothetical protein